LQIHKVVANHSTISTESSIIAPDDYRKDYGKSIKMHVLPLGKSVVQIAPYL